MARWVTPIDAAGSAPPADIDAAGRERLRRGRVLIVGVGGLGAPAALALAAAGIGTLGLIDGDTVELSNLNRQILYRTSDLGVAKVRAAAARLAALDPHLTIRCFETPLSAANLDAVFAGFDFVIDGSDGVATKFLVNDGAIQRRLPFSHAGVLGFHGQLLTVLPGRSACLRCLFPTPPAADDVPNCQEAGIVGAVAGSISLLQAAEAAKWVLGIGTLLADRLLTYDARHGRWRGVGLSRNPACAVCGHLASRRVPGVIAPAGGACE